MKNRKGSLNQSDLPPPIAEQLGNAPPDKEVLARLLGNYLQQQLTAGDRNLAPTVSALISLASFWERREQQSDGGGLTNTTLVQVPYWIVALLGRAFIDYVEALDLGKAKPLGTFFGCEGLGPGVQNPLKGSQIRARNIRLAMLIARYHHGGMSVEKAINAVISDLSESAQERTSTDSLWRIWKEHGSQAMKVVSTIIKAGPNDRDPLT